MEKLESLIELIKKTKSSGPIISKIKNSNHFREIIKEIENRTSYLDEEYFLIPLGQRIYHLVNSSNGTERCLCGKPKEFNRYGRFSSVKEKKDSNYNNHCGSLECVIKDFVQQGFSGKGYGGLIGKISNDNNLKKQLLNKTEFLNSHYDKISDSQRFYHVFFDKHEIEKCTCGNPKKFSPYNKFSSSLTLRKGANYNETCNSPECVSKSINDSLKKSIFEKYGVSNLWDIPGYRENLQKNNIEKYGTPYIMGSDYFKAKTKEKIEKDWDGFHPTKFKEVQDKKKKTNLERYGIDCILKDREKMKSGMIEKYGEAHNMKLESHKNNHRKIMEDKFGGFFMQSDEIKRKSIETNLEKYGYKFATQNDDISEKQFKNSRKFKDYFFPSGKSIKIQGFEGNAIDILLNTYEEDDIETSRKEISKLVGNFMYNFEGIDRRYFPDIYIKSINSIIEVKSEYTFSQEPVKNNLKKLSVENKNIGFKYMIFTNDGKKLKS
jgi:hypothetical protein